MLYLIKVTFLVLFAELAGVGVLTIILRLLCNLKKNK